MYPPMTTPILDLTAMSFEILESLDCAYALLTNSKGLEYTSPAFHKRLKQLRLDPDAVEAKIHDLDLPADTLELSGNRLSFKFSGQQLSNGYILLKESHQVVTDNAIIKQALASLADCNLAMDLADLNGNDSNELSGYLQTTFANLNEAIKQIAKNSRNIIGVTHQIDQQSQALSERSQQQATAAESTSASMEELRATVATNAEQATQAESLSKQAVTLAEQGHKSVERVVSSIGDINEGSEKIIKIIETVDLIAFKTNILALNAAIEAAHAGEHGKGFAVVADEVRALAKQSSAASSEIKEIITTTIKACRGAQVVADETDSAVNDIADRIKAISAALENIGTASREQSIGVTQVSEALDEITTLTEHNSREAIRLSEHTQRLSRDVDQMQDVVSIFKLNTQAFSHPLHEEICHVVQSAAESLSSAMESAINQKLISANALFDRHYEEIAGTNPVRYSTQFDEFTDQYMADYQEHWLTQHDSLVYLIMSDNNGYVPTHNLAFSQPLTGDIKTDTARNRTKRIFTDRVGQSVGKHEEAFLLQAYRRDTGELMFDLSVPLYVNGRHWGGVRAGYRII